MDQWLFSTFNQQAGWGSWLDYVAWFLAVASPALFAVLLVLRWLFPGSDRRLGRHAVLLAVSSCVFAIGLSELPALLYFRERPFVAWHWAFNMLNENPTQSFPSVHATAGFAIATSLGWQSRLWGWLTWPVALGMGWARVYGGVHYPSDILGGLVLGFSTAWLYLEFHPELEPALDRIMELLPQGSPTRQRLRPR